MKMPSQIGFNMRNVRLAGVLLVLHAGCFAVAHAKYYGKAYPEKVRDEWIRAPQTDEILHQVFFPGLRNGKFIEVGAFDGLADSNTAFFEREMGWSGLLVEPFPKHVQKLQQNRGSSGGRGKVSIVQAAVCPAGQTIALYEDNLKSGVNVPSKADAVPLMFNCVPLQSVLQTHPGLEQVDLLVIDVEDSERMVLETIDFSRVQVRVMLLDESRSCHVEGIDECGDYLESVGFCYAGKSARQEFWVAKRDPQVSRFCAEPLTTIIINELVQKRRSASPPGGVTMGFSSGAQQPQQPALAAGFDFASSSGAFGAPLATLGLNQGISSAARVGASPPSSGSGQVPTDAGTSMSLKLTSGSGRVSHSDAVDNYAPSAGSFGSVPFVVALDDSSQVRPGSFGNIAASLSDKPSAPAAFELAASADSNFQSADALAPATPSLVSQTVMSTEQIEELYASAGFGSRATLQQEQQHQQAPSFAAHNSLPLTANAWEASTQTTSHTMMVGEQAQQAATVPVASSAAFPAEPGKGADPERDGLFQDLAQLSQNLKMINEVASTQMREVEAVKSSMSEMQANLASQLRELRAAVSGTFAAASRSQAPEEEHAASDPLDEASPSSQSVGEEPATRQVTRRLNRKVYVAASEADVPRGEAPEPVDAKSTKKDTPVDDLWARRALRGKTAEELGQEHEQKQPHLEQPGQNKVGGLRRMEEHSPRVETQPASQTATQARSKAPTPFSGILSSSMIALTVVLVVLYINFVTEAQPRRAVLAVNIAGFAVSLMLFVLNLLLSKGLIPQYYQLSRLPRIVWAFYTVQAVLSCAGVLYMVWLHRGQKDAELDRDRRGELYIFYFCEVAVAYMAYAGGCFFSAAPNSLSPFGNQTLSLVVGVELHLLGIWVYVMNLALTASRANTKTSYLPTHHKVTAITTSGADEKKQLQERSFVL
ncbi:hypothetical protein FVE85_0188 [Porphyridium purpureum]|uniref:Methyltransferase FkbM domain-containing protein n=1 Tax=Porphyridium purpureum TaxID=35688 RepID=A0A5J4YXZ2_PORPP|nr:hypothetical protein FVE85_0188 [Porphyridium purpureum]|eukprot:POR3149..scf208_2